ncbi:hypothetical protein HK104_005162 [Borealophlyctis nickersoniae]|nr:hypothetical protein HK104_005162 [Borealophlyctis nickersoniae]
MAVIAIDPTTGRLADVPAETRNYSGSGPNKDRQEASHPHQFIWRVSSSVTTVYVPDLGADCMRRHTFDATTGTLTDLPSAPATSPGSGPRHLAFHPTHPLAYVINELSNTVSTFSIDDPSPSTPTPTMTPHATPPISILQQGDAIDADKTAGEIAVAPSGRYIYTSQRGYDYITVLKLDDTTKVPTGVVQWYKLRGKGPRHFTLVGEDLMLVGLQYSRMIEILEVDKESGKVKSVGLVEGVPDEPQCLAVF